MMPDVHTLYSVIEGTWPAYAYQTVGPWTIREGCGGGKRVSSATGNACADTDSVAAAEEAMRALGQAALFMIREGDEALDQMLERHGYAITDPVNIYACPVTQLTGERPPRTATFNLWEPMAIQIDIWAAGGIGQGRVAVMNRASHPKTALFGRDDNRPAATGFAAIHDGIAMVHAIEVLPPHRRRGMGRHLMAEAAFWAADHSANHMSVICTKDNQGANALYASLGMTPVGQYHYRQKQD